MKFAKFKKKSLIALSSILVLSGLVGCQSNSSEKEGTIKVGLVAPLSGAMAQDGKSILNAAQLAVDEVNKEGGINKKKIELVYEDDKGEPKEAASIANKYSSDKDIMAVMGSFSAPCTLAGIPIYTKAKIPMMGPCGSAPALSGSSEYYRKVTPSDLTTGKELSKWMLKDMNYKKVAIIYVNNDYGKGVAESVDNFYKENGGQVVAKESYMPKTQDFGSIITKVKSKNPDIIIMGSFYGDAGAFLKQAHNVGYNPKVAGPTPLLSKSLVDLAGKDAEGIFTIGSFSTNLENEKVKEFTEKYKKKYNQAPSSFAAYSYDATKILIEGIKKGGNDREKINEALKNMGTYTGVTGNTKFEKSGDAEKNLIRFVVKDGKFVEWKK
ncbi:ABC transporter substrate-binding protein [Clostridium sporogenes]